MSPPPVDSSIRAALKLHSPQVVGIVNNYLKLLQIETRVRSYSADLRQAAAFANATRQTGEARQTDGRYKYAKFRRRLEISRKKSEIRGKSGSRIRTVIRIGLKS